MIEFEFDERILMVFLVLFVGFGTACSVIYMPPSETPPPGDEPILMIHGFADVHWSPWWDRLDYYLRRSGYPPEDLHRMNLGDIPGVTVGHPRQYGNVICERLSVLHRKKNRRVDVVAHSMGGLGARWCIQERNGNRFVDDLITLGTPHQGVEGTVEASGWTHYFLGYAPEGAEALDPDSEFLEQLNEGPLPGDVEFTAVWSRTDYVFFLSEWRHNVNGYYPEHLAESPNVRNLELPFREGHLDLISSKRVFNYYKHHLD